VNAIVVKNRLKVLIRLHIGYRSFLAIVIILLRCNFKV
jgi:hypothetical protein